MKKGRGKWENGNAMLEYGILIPIVFTCVYVTILIFMVLYQKALIQNIAENAAESLSRQWGYYPVPVEEMDTGVYKKTTYETREIYWHLKLWKNASKAAVASRQVKANIKGIGLLVPYHPGGSQPGEEPEPNANVNINFVPGFPSTLTVDIKALYTMPGQRLMKLIGWGDHMTIGGKAQVKVYDPKDMIDTTDYVVQIIRGTKTYQLFMEKLQPLKNNLKKMID